MDGHALPEWNGLGAMATAVSFEAGLFIIWTLFGPLELWMTSLVANETLYDKHPYLLMDHALRRRRALLLKLRTVLEDVVV